jgi:hypothetical protein
LLKQRKSLVAKYTEGLIVWLAGKGNGQEITFVHVGAMESRCKHNGLYTAHCNAEIMQVAINLIKGGRTLGLSSRRALSSQYSVL